MKKLVVLLMLGLFVSSAFAAVDPDANSVGFYWDTDANTTELAALLPYQSLYVVLVNPTFDGIKGLEFGIDWDPTTNTCFGFMMPAADWTNYGNNNQVIIGIAAAYPTTVTTVMGYFVMNATAPTYFTLRGLDSPSIEGDYPVVVDGNDEMYQIGCSVLPGEVAATIGVTGVVVDAESETWGGVKSLYR